MRCRRFASSPSTLTTIVTFAPECGSTTWTSRGSMASSSASKSPGWGPDLSRDPWPSLLEDSALARGRFPARDDQPGCQIDGWFHDERQSVTALGAAGSSGGLPTRWRIVFSMSYLILACLASSAISSSVIGVPLAVFPGSFASCSRLAGARAS